MNEQIESLAIEKDFASLSMAERSFVLAEMSQEDFEHLRSVLLTARQMDASVQAPARLRAQLLDKMASQPKPSPMMKAMGFRIPVWQAAAALMLGIFASWLLKPATILEKTVTEIQVRVDTVWQEKTVYRERVVWRERVVNQVKPSVEPIAVVPEKTETQKIETVFSEPTFGATRVGTSLGDAPELMRFFTQADK